MRTFHKALINLLLILVFLAVVYVYNINELTLGQEQTTRVSMAPVSDGPVNPYYRTNVTVSVWCIFTKAAGNPPMKGKFTTFTKSLLQHSSALVSLNIIVDAASQRIAQEVIETAKKATGRGVQTTYHEITQFARQLKGLIAVMQPHFSPHQGSYYSDSLFFVSLGLHSVAPSSENQVIMFDIDTKLMDDVMKLHDYFDSFGNDTLFGLCPEMSTVYRNAFNTYRTAHPNTTLGDPPAHGGYPGLNSGVLLLKLNKLRQSMKYKSLVTASSVSSLCKKYQFKGHLGDQDFYTLLGFEHPELVKILPCGWNHQLCMWWRDNGYKHIMPLYNRCNDPVYLYHGGTLTKFQFALIIKNGAKFWEHKNHDGFLKKRLKSMGKRHEINNF